MDPEWFPFVKATRHLDAVKIIATAFPCFASTALYLASETSSTVRNSC